MRRYANKALYKPTFRLQHANLSEPPNTKECFSQFSTLSPNSSMSRTNIFKQRGQQGYFMEIVSIDNSNQFFHPKSHIYQYNRKFSSDSISKDTEKIKSKALSLRRLASPFLQLCHPDKFAHIASAQKVNLSAVQTLNELIDTCEKISSRKPNTKGMGSNNQFMKSRYVIEFMVPSSLSSGSKTGLRRSKDNMCTRREVTLSFGNGSWNNINSSGIATPKQVQDLRKRARREIRNLIRMAGLNPPKDDMEEEDLMEENQGNIHDVLWDELNIKPAGKRKSRVRWEDSQARFRRSIDWKKRKELWDNAVRSMEEDYATTKLTSEHRKRQIIADVVSRIRFRNSTSESNEDEITPMDQLIALRRISLLFTDHFDEMDIEMHGRTWEKLIIVLNNDHDNSLAMRKRRRRRIGGESGFKFSVSGDVVTATVPIDFLDEEILQEFERNLDDLYEDDDDIFDFM